MDSANKLVLVFLIVLSTRFSVLGLTCGKNAAFTKCSGCEASCNNPEPRCLLQCEPPRCQCLKGFMRTLKESASLKKNVLRKPEYRSRSEESD
uniref:Uncharacterized protein n=1 Tax=Ditylenchus dipsaci TaxID=166011 RepID=A0A915EQ68_9BILA